MAAQIMAAGDAQSKVFAPCGSFLLTLRAATGTIEGDWFLYYSVDKDAPESDWQKAHDSAFSETNYSDVFDVGPGFFFQLRGGTGTNIEAHFAHIVSIPDGKLDDAKAIIAEG